MVGPVVRWVEPHRGPNKSEESELSLRGYTQGAAVVFVVAALIGFVFGWAGYSGFLAPGFAENTMHLLLGLLFAFFGFSWSDTDAVRYFVGGMGVLLVAGKGVLLVVNVWGAQSIFGTVTEVACMVLGVSSILAAVYLR